MFRAYKHQARVDMKILVTGANGYLGKGVVKHLLDSGIDVVATDITDDHIDRRAHIICCDLFCTENPFEFFDKPDVVLHMAWRNGFVHNDISHINDLPLHYRFAELMIKGGIKKFVGLGSMHEVGFYEGSISETTSTNPQSLYGISKNSLRKLIELKCSDYNCIYQWLRGFYIVGNTSDGCSIFSKIVQSAIEGKKEFPFTMGLNQFDFLDYEIFCKYVVDAVLQNEVDGIINICSGRPEQLACRVERFIQENGFDIKLLYGMFPDRPYDSKAIWGNDSKIRMIEGNIKENG